MSIYENAEATGGLDESAGLDAPTSSVRRNTVAQYKDAAQSKWRDLGAKGQLGLCGAVAALLLLWAVASGGDAPGDRASAGSLALPPAGTGTARITVLTSARDYAGTGGNVYVSLIGTRHSTPEVLVSHGLRARALYSARVPYNEAIGVPKTVHIRLEGNDGVHFAEIECDIAGRTYVWVRAGWLDGDSQGYLPTKDFSFSASSQRLTGSSQPVAITVSTGDGITHDDAKYPRTVTVYGYAGHTGPLQLTNGARTKHVTTYRFNIADVGALETLKFSNAGPESWMIGMVEMDYKGQRLSWSYGHWLQGDRRTSMDAAFLYPDDASQLAVNAGQVATTVQIFVAAEENSGTTGDLMVTLQGASGSTGEMPVSHSVHAREMVTRVLYHAEIGALRTMTLRLIGNDGILIEEVRSVDSHGNALTWLFPKGGGWLDGNAADPSIMDTATLSFRNAMPKVTSADAQAAAAQPGNTQPTEFQVIIKTLTGRSQDAGTRANSIEVVLFGDMAYFGPFVLNSEAITGLQGRDGGQSSYTVMCPVAIGQLTAVKLYNTGTDAWELRGLSVQISSTDWLFWSYNKWLDGDGAGPHQPAADIFYTKAAAVISSQMVATTVMVGGSSLENAQTTASISVVLHFVDGTMSGAAVSTLGLEARKMTEFRFAHPNVAIQAITVQLQGDDSAHIAEVRTDIGFGGTNQFEHAWFLTELNGWLAKNSLVAPASRTYDVSTALRALPYAGPTASNPAGGSQLKIVVDTTTGSVSYSATASTILIEFIGPGGYEPPQVLSTGFEAGDKDSFEFYVSSKMVEFWGAKIINTGSDGWFLEQLTISVFDKASNTARLPSITYQYNAWLDGNGQSATTAPQSNIFYADGTWNSQKTISNFEVKMACPAEFAQCQTSCLANLPTVSTAATQSSGYSTLPAGLLSNDAGLTAVANCLSRVVRGTTSSG